MKLICCKSVAIYNTNVAKRQFTVVFLTHNLFAMIPTTFNKEMDEVLLVYANFGCDMFSSC